MNEEYSGCSTYGNRKEEEYVNANEKLPSDYHEYLNSDVSIQNRLSYETIGEKFEIDPNTLVIIKVIGKGHFSDVYMGILSLPNESITVAVKKPQMDTGSMNALDGEAILQRQRQALRDELSIFAHLQSSSTGGHENVLKLLGAITTIKTDFSLLTEYCERGSLDRFLQEKWKNGKFEDELAFEGNEKEQVWKRDSNWGDNYQSRREKGLITTSDLLWFTLQIARAMQFLVAMNVTHRDIAVRNVLLKSDYTLKVSDFGLSRKLKENDDAYCIGDKGTVLPIRYIAPESLTSGRFAITSEFWSFGVVVWELFTFAEKQPYSVEFDNNENNVEFFEFLVEHLSYGHRLLIPDYVPQQINSLLSRLWHSEPKRRLSFEICRKVIRQELMQSCPNILLREKAPHHGLEYSLFRFDDEHVHSRTLQSHNSPPLDVNISALPLRENQQTEQLEIRVRNKIIFQICASILCVCLITPLIAVILILIMTISTGKPSSLSVVSPDPEYTGLFFISEVGKIFELAIPYENVADLGNATAQFHLGITYDIGQGVNQSDEKAVEWYREAAEQGSTGAQNNLGEKYLKGRGVPQSDEEAVKWYRKAAEQGYAIAQFNLGLMYQSGRGVHQSDEEAVKWVKKAAEQGDANAQAKLGFMYQNGRGVSQSDEEAVKWVRRAAEKGNANGQVNFGWMYQFGLGIPQSDAEAVKWYRKSADQGDANAQDSLGFMYLNGRGVPQSDEEAVKWFRKAAEQGYVEDQFNLGFMYQNGFGVPQSYDEAAKWYRKAVEQKDAMAQFNLEIMYQEGKGINQSYEEAVKWYKKMAEQGNAAAQNNLGWMYHIGLGVLQSDKEAIKLLTKSAEQGNPGAQYNLGIMNRNGFGVPQSYEEAIKWYKKSAEQGYALAKDFLGTT